MKRIPFLLLAALLLAGACSAPATVAPPTPAPTPPAVTPDAPFKAYPPELAPASAETTQHITLEVKDVNLEVAPGE